MIKWFDYATNAKNPPRNRALLAYCPDWCDIGYAVVTWNGANFEDEIRGEDIHDYVVKVVAYFWKQIRRITTNAKGNALSKISLCNVCTDTQNCP